MQWKPAHETHAIERVSVTVSFNEAIPSKIWQPLLDAATASLLALGFDSRSDIGLPPAAARGVMSAHIVFGPGGQVTPGLGENSGRVFRTSQGNDGEEIYFQRHLLTYATRGYERWKAFYSRFSDALGESIKDILKYVDISVIKLEYWDRFTFDGPIADASYAELLNADAELLPTFPLTTESLWHSHVGYYAAPPFVGARRLINLNLDAVDLPRRQDDDAPGGEEQQDGQLSRSVGIYSMAQDMLIAPAIPGALPLEINLLDSLHSELKIVIEDVLSAAAAGAISLVVGA